MTGAAEVRLWSVGLEVDPALLAVCESLLDDMERGRGARFAFQRDRRRHAVSHAAARLLAAEALGLSPTALCWSAGRFGRPRVSGYSLSVSLSRSHETALLALSDNSRVGVDIEAQAHASPEPAWLAPHVDATALALAARSGSTAGSAWFYEGWTRVEALAKARGVGIAQPAPHRWDPWQPGLPLELEDDEGRQRRWHVTSLAVPPGSGEDRTVYHAALAADHPLGRPTPCRIALADLLARRDHRGCA